MRGPCCFPGRHQTCRPAPRITRIRHLSCVRRLGQRPPARPTSASPHDRTCRADQGRPGPTPGLARAGQPIRYDLDRQLLVTQVNQLCRRQDSTDSVDRSPDRDTMACKGGGCMAHTPGTLSASGGRPRGNGTGRDRSRIVLDDVSKQIIEQLQQDGRRSYAAIGKAVGLSEAAVRQRVQRLVDAGVMQVVAVTDPLMLGFRRQTMIGVRCVGDIERVADLLAAITEIDYVVITAGSFDLLIEVVCEDDDQLLEIISRVRTIPCVTSTETCVYLKLRKQTYGWGTR